MQQVLWGFLCKKKKKMRGVHTRKKSEVSTRHQFFKKKENVCVHCIHLETMGGAGGGCGCGWVRCAHCSLICICVWKGGWLNRTQKEKEKKQENSHISDMSTKHIRLTFFIAQRMLSSNVHFVPKKKMFLQCEEKNRYSGVHPGVSTLIQPSFQKKEKRKSTQKKKG